MPISPLVLQRRHAELGRIRLGAKEQFTRRDGSAGTRPAKLDRFRFTSPQRGLIEAVAALYGGTVKAWDSSGKPEFEVLTTAQSLPVIVVKGGLTQWMEFWSSGGCIHRCDGERNVLTDSPCDLREMVQVGREAVNPHSEAKPTTRLSVMLRDVESLGVWRMETHGWNAAAEIPAMAELAMFVGDLVPATLHLVERRAIKDGKTSRFVVPVLDLMVSKQRLVEIVGAQTGGGAIEAAPGVAAIAAPPMPDYGALIADATTVEECRALWTQAQTAGHLGPDLDAAIRARVEQVTPTPAQLPAPEPAPPAREHAADEGRALPDSGSVWAQIVAEGGERGWTTSTLADAFDAFAGGISVADADAWTLEGFLTALQNGQIERAA